MAIITEKQISTYLDCDKITFENDSAYQKASNLEKQQNFDYTISATAVRELFTDITQNYMKSAEKEENLVHRAVLYAHARKILTKHFHYDYDSKIRELRERVIFREAITCAGVVRETADCSLQASWAFKSADLLDPNPTEYPIQDSVYDDSAETIGKYMQAAQSWEMLADIFLTHKNKVYLAGARLLADYPHKPEYVAAKLYELASYSTRNANFIKQYNKNLNSNYLDDRRVQLLDKSISALESLGIKINDLIFNANYFAMLASLYQHKINICETGNLSDLKSKVFRFRMESVELLREILQKDPDLYPLLYEKAFNLKEAARYVKTVGEAAKLLKEAASAALVFRERCHLPCHHRTSGEDDRASNAFTILQYHFEMEKLLTEKGPNHLLA